MVRVEGVEPSSHAWEAYIIAVIRYPRWLYYSTLQSKRLTVYCEAQNANVFFVLGRIIQWGGGDEITRSVKELRP